MQLVKQLPILVLLLLLLQPSLFSQQEPDLSAYQAKWPEEDAVYLKLYKSIDIALEGQRIDITTAYDERMLFMSENAAVLADRNLGYSSFREILEIDARTLVPDNNKMKSLQVNEIRESDRMSGGVFVDDYKEKSFVFPGVKPGAVAELKYRERVKEPRFLGAFYFNTYIPVEESELSVTFDEGVSLKYILLGSAADIVEFSETKSKGRKTLSWKTKGQESMTYEEGAPALNYYEPHIVVYIDEVVYKDGSSEKILSDVSSLYAWYRTLTKEINQEENEEIKSIVNELVEGATSEEEKVRRIFNWVQDNIRYIAFEEGLGGFIPREAAKVCNNKYGDCKDMASLTTEMLEYAGIAANLTWIGTRDIPYSYEDVPTPIVDNHMIASVEINGERIFLDATDNQVAFGYPSSFIQGKQAMVGMGDSYQLVKVPEVTKTENTITHELSISIQDGLAYGKGKTTYMGYPRFNIKRRLDDTRADRQEIFFKNVLNLGNNKSEISGITLSGLEARNPSFSMEYDLNMPDYAKAIGKEVYFNLNLDKRLQHQQIDMEKRERDREFEFRYTSNSKVVLEIPAGHKVDYLPESSSFDGAAFGYTQAYSELDGKVFCNTSVYVDCLLLEKKDFERWNEMIDALDAAYQEVVVFIAE